MSFSEKKFPLKSSREILVYVLHPPSLPPHPPSLPPSDSAVFSLCHCPRGNQQGHFPSQSQACHKSTQLDTNEDVSLPFVFPSRCKDVGLTFVRMNFFNPRERDLPL